MAEKLTILSASVIIAASLLYLSETGRYQLINDGGLAVLIDTRTGEVFDCVRDGVIMDSKHPSDAAKPVISVDGNLGRLERRLLLSCGNPKVISEHRRNERE